MVEEIMERLKFSKKESIPLIEITSRELSMDEIKGMNLDVNQNFFEIKVQDNGIGFDQKYAERIFNIFQRLHLKSEFEGTGIGLALCKKIALNHHGDLNAKESSESGAVFNIVLPAKQKR